MGVPSILSLFLLCHLLFLHHSSGKCPDSFNCGTHGQLSFPLSNETFPVCGLYTVQNCDSVPKLHLGAVELYFNSMNHQENSINVSDPRLENLDRTNICDIFFSSGLQESLRNTPSISLTKSPVLTLFKCNNPYPGLEREPNVIFQGNDSYGCHGFTVYYKYPHHYQDPNYRGIAPCTVIELPMVSELGNRNASDLLSVLTSEFSIWFNVSKECSDCRKGGTCTPSTDPGCKNEKKGRFHLGLILCTVIPGVIVFACLLILIIRYHKNLRSCISSCTIRRNISSDNFSKDDLEEGSAYFGIPVFSYSELKEATHNFDPSKELGNGGFGTVYHGKLQDGREVAVKRLYEHNYKRVTQFQNEIEILTDLRHPSLVTLYGCTSRHSRELLLVYEYIPNGTVADHLYGDRAKDHPLPWPIRMNIAIETASALVYLHASEIIHRDVKTNNILLDNNFCVKVADFGLSRLFPTDVSHVSTAPQGTPGYVDPEYHQCYQLTDKSDVYSFGVVLVELISSLPAVDISRHRHEINLANLAINRIQEGAFNKLIDPSLGFDSDSSVERMTTSVAEVAFQCLQLEKEMRPRMNEVLEALKEIQEYKDEEMGEILPLSPDGRDNVELLNSSKVPPSPNSVTNEWLSSSNTSIAGA